MWSFLFIKHKRDKYLFFTSARIGRVQRESNYWSKSEEGIKLSWISVFKCFFFVCLCRWVGLRSVSQSTLHKLLHYSFYVSSLRRNNVWSWMRYGKEVMHEWPMQILSARVGVMGGQLKLWSGPIEGHFRAVRCVAVETFLSVFGHDPVGGPVIYNWEVLHRF